MRLKRASADWTTGDHHRLSSVTVRVLVATLCAVQFIDVLATTVVIVALPTIQMDLGLGDGAREQVVGIYALLFGSLLLLAGRLADAWGARRLFIAGLITFGIGSVIGGLAPEGGSLIVGRGIQGVGAALAVPSALAMVAGLFPPGDGRNRVLGYWAATGAAGGAAGFALGGVISDLIGWRWTLLMNVLPIVLATVAMLLIHFPEPIRGRITIPVVPSLTLTFGLLALTLGLSNGQTRTVDPLTVLLPITTGLVLLGAFARGERGERPLVPRSAWRDRALLTGSAVGFTLTFTTSAVAVLLTLYLQQIEGVSAAATGWLLAPFSVAVVGGASLGSRWISRRGAVGPMRWGLLGVAASLGVWVMAVGVGSVTLIVIGLVLAGLALGVASVASTAHGLVATNADEYGVASGLLNAAARVGTAVGIAVFGIVAATGRFVSAGDNIVATVTGYQAAFLVGIGLVLATVVLIREPSLDRGRFRWRRQP